MAAAGMLTESKSHQSPYTVGAKETLMLRSFVCTNKYFSDNNNQHISSIAGQALGVELENSQSHLRSDLSAMYTQS